MHNTKTRHSFLLALLAGGIGLGGAVQAAEVNLRVVGNYSGNRIHVEEVERPFFDSLNAREDMRVTYNTMDSIGVDAADALRRVRAGTFDVMSVQIGMASRDDPFFEGIDLAGVAQNLDEQRAAVDAIRERFDARLQERFNTKLMTLWPFGPQMLYCNAEITSVDDLAGKRIRVFTPSMSRLVEALGATPVTLQFSEVYMALQRGVADCAVTAPTAGNNGKWPEVTTHFMPLPLSYSVQGHFMNLDSWNRLDARQQEELSAAFAEMEEQMWRVAYEVNDDAIACNTGRPGCELHTAYDMTLVELNGESGALIRELTDRVVLPVWAENCEQRYAGCGEAWNQTVGASAGYTIPSR